MGKRSDEVRIPKDKYYTWDGRAYPIIAPHLAEYSYFLEPCAGGGDMIVALEAMGLQCVGAGDIEPTGPVGPASWDGKIEQRPYEDSPMDEIEACDLIITNPPWKRSMLHPFLDWVIELGKPAWLLIDSNWSFTKQARPFLRHCAMIVPTPRLKWIPDTAHNAMDDTSWYLFKPEVCDTIFLNALESLAAMSNDALELIG
jgi:hypothetical protein